MNSLAALVLAAGHGKRMKSALPKVMHTLAGRPLVHYPVAAAIAAGAQQVVVVVGHERKPVADYLCGTFGDRVCLALQEEQRGTGHAALQGLPAVASETESILVVYGDTPLLRVEDLCSLIAAKKSHPSAPLAMLTCLIGNPAGYGRVLRHDGRLVQEVREDRDLRTDAERAICEVNPGVYCADRSFLASALRALTPNNAQGEQYLTDIVAQAASRGGVVDVLGDPVNLLGVNDRCQLAEAETLMQQRILERLRRSGVTIRSGAVIEDTVEVEPDATIEPGVILRGCTRIGAGARIDVGCVVTDSVIADGATLKPYSVLTDARVERDAQVGPFSHLRPASVIGERAHVGNFVETKKTTLHAGAKANHLAYLGDGDVGEGANVGAGTIFCNYDGFQKHRTVIGNGAFIGSDSQLVAPVTVGERAYVATGTTVTRDVPADALAVGRVRQENKEGYATRLRERMRAAAEAAKKGNP